MGVRLPPPDSQKAPSSARSTGRPSVADSQQTAKLKATPDPSRVGTPSPVPPGGGGPSKFKTAGPSQQQQQQGAPPRAQVQVKLALPVQAQCLTVNSSVESSDDEDEEADGLHEVAVLSAGNSFGELALLKNKLRAATIRCKDTCHFAVIERRDYQKVLMRMEQKRLDEVTDFLQALPYFSHWARHSLQKLQYFFEKRVYIREQPVFAEGEEDPFLYLVREGEFTSLASLVPTKEREEHDQLAMSSSRRNVKKHLRLAQQPGRSAKKTRFDLRMEVLGYLGSKAVAKKTRVALMSQGQIFGEEYLEYDIASLRRNYTVKCSSMQGALLCIRREVGGHTHSPSRSSRAECRTTTAAGRCCSARPSSRRATSSTKYTPRSTCSSRTP